MVVGSALSLLFFQSAPAQSPVGAVRACWLEMSSGDMPGSLGGAGLPDAPPWHSTVSAILINHPKGDVLVDAGFSPDAAKQMDELPGSARAFGLQVLAGAKGGRSITDALSAEGENPQSVTRLIATHAHYDHIGGASLLRAPVYVSASEAKWMAAQAAKPTIVPPSLVAALKPRIRTLAYDSGPYLGFARSQDIYGDGSIVAVPLPGHTPGSQGIFLKAGGRWVFLIGDATDTLAAAERGLPKSEAIRGATDFDPATADAEATALATFRRSHPDIAMIPAHDRTAYIAVFGVPTSCIPARPNGR